MQFELHVATEPAEGIVKLRLLDQHGTQLAFNQVQVSDHRRLEWEGLFDTRRYIQTYAGNLIRPGQARPATADELLAEIGLFLGRDVLGRDIMKHLGGIQQRSLLVRLPTAAHDQLAAALARVPWEMAHLEPGEPPLLERTLAVRAAAGEPLLPPAQAEEEPGVLRVLFIFAEAPGSRPLAMRLERERLLRLFFEEILPYRRIEVDVLCHGVTRALLREQVASRSGYHVVHWSGHGHHDLLELRSDDGGREPLTGADLVKLFTEAGGFIPRLMFLSSCLSGTLTRARDWAAFREALAAQDSPGTNPTRAPAAQPESERNVAEVLASRPGYTGTALALLHCGVPQVIAMRYEVGDAYARELARRFYKHALADEGAHPVDGALSLARHELLQDKGWAKAFSAVDHATPLLFGERQLTLRARPGRSEQLKRARPKPQPLLPGSTELDPPADFVGRGEELTELAIGWLPRRGPAIALVQGLAGMGKTALAAEVIELWHRRFAWVLAFQAKPTPLPLNEFYRQLDFKLTLASETYIDKCNASPYERVYLEPSKLLTGAQRYEKLRNNLVEALRDEDILLVLDNFETNLAPASAGGDCACADPEWDLLLSRLAETLPNTGSRVLVTSRHRLAALAAADKAVWIALGPLPVAELGHYLQSHERLRKLYFADAEAQGLVERLLRVSRGHPLILSRLAALAGDREALARALDQLEKRGLQDLPDLFAGARTEAERLRERAYLEDLAAGSIDLLLERASEDARRLLWMVTLANEPVSEALIESIWSGRSPREEQLYQLRALLARAEELPDEVRAKLDAMPEEIRAALAQMSSKSQVPAVGPLLEELYHAGLLTIEGKRDDGPRSGTDSYGFHELVRERVDKWMDVHPQERGNKTETEVWQAYAEHYEAAFESLAKVDRENVQEEAAEAGRRAVSYLVRARSFQRLGQLAGSLAISTRDPVLLHGVIVELNTVADQVPEGQDRWRLRLALADALDNANRHDEALPFYEQAENEARQAENWAAVGIICHNSAAALGQVGRLAAARAAYQRSARAEKEAGSPRISILASELEALRLDVLEGGADNALPEIEKRLNELRAWWSSHRSGKAAPEAPSMDELSRTLIGALDIAGTANLSLSHWEACLDVIAETEEIKRALHASSHEIARTRFNRYGPLLRLGKLDEAQELLEQTWESVPSIR